tara:strand:+ start:709 stop:1503 length:795 start_codon:yes stop_codon:yes gene_type:complete
MKILKLGQMLGGSNSPSGTAYENLYSLTFDGVDDYVKFDDANVFTPNNSGGDRGFSFSFWFKAADPTSQRVLSKNSLFYSGATHYEYLITTDYADRIKIVLYAGDSISNAITLRIDTALSADAWYHIAFTWDLGATNADLIGYVNGTAYSGALGNATWTLTGSWSSVSNTNNLLEFAKDSGNYGAIQLDEVALFDDELSSGEVSAIYNSGTPTDLSGESYLLGYWRNGDIDGTDVYPTIEDYSSNSNDGTMTNMAAEDIVTDAP